MRGFLAKLCKKNGIAKRIGSLSLALLMALSTLQALPAGILVAHATGTETTVKSPIVNEDGSITFNLAKGDYTSAEVMGTVPGCSWNIGSGFEMTLNAEGDLYTYTTVAGIAPGTYEYKFVTNGSNWITDPANTQTSNGNSVVVIPSGVESPIVNEDGSITFNLPNQGYTSVEVMGTVPGCSWDLGSGFDMTLNNEGDLYTYTTAAGIAPGTYEYKFVTNGSNWITDPSNTQTLNGNSVVVIPGGLESPVIEGNQVTFNYKAAEDFDKQVYLRGAMTNWATDQKELTDADGDKVYSLTLTLEPGTYEYKFWYDDGTDSGNWFTDPLNTQQSNGNSVVVIPSSVESPIVNEDGSITFNLAKGEYASVEVMGTVPGCSWTPGSGFAMELNDEGDLYTYTTAAGIAPGAYEYKFVADSAWITDPSNTLFIGQNSAAVVPGLANATVEPEKGVVTDLPETLESFTAGSTASTNVAVTYTLDNAELADEVTIDNTNHTIKVKKSCTETEFTLTATAGLQTSKVYVRPTEKIYTYTVYYYDFVEEHMADGAADMYVWANDGSTVTSPATFTKETLSDGNVWLKAVVKTASTDIGFIPRSAGKWASEGGWQTTDLGYKNTSKAESVTLYATSTSAAVSTTLPTLETPRERYVIIAYERTNADYSTDTTGWNIYSWNTGFGSSTEIYGELLNGEYVMVVPIRDSEVDMNLGFCLRNSEKAEDGNKWADKEGGDHYVTIPADQEVVKVYFEQGKGQVDTLTYNKSYDIDGSKDTITFYYRDDAALVAKNSAQLSETVKVVVDGTEYEMTYDAENERYYYALQNCTNGDYEFSYKVGSKVVEDKFANGVVTYKSFDDLSITGTLSQATMDYNDNNVLTVAFAGSDASLIDYTDVESISADLSVLGLDSEFAIAPELMEGTISVDRKVAAGQYAMPVTLKDKYGNTYTTSVRVEVTERDEDVFDWDEAVIYMTCTDRFFDENKENNTGVDKTDSLAYHGGDFAGLTAKLDYLEDLGVNTIWITPIVENSNTTNDDVVSTGYHGYWASDFTKLNPYLGTEEEFETLLTEAHNRDMKIMVDVVLNHAGYGMEDYFNEVMDDAENDIDITMIRDAEHTIPGDDIYSGDSLSGLLDFMTEDPVVRDQLVEWQVNWMDKFDIDYYRVDTVKHVDNVTWQAFKNELTKVNPDFKMIGEYYGAGYAGTGGALGTGTMDSLLDFDTNDKAKDFVTGKITDVEAFYVDRNENISNSATLGGFLSSHDENSFVDMLINEKGKTEAEALELAKVAAALQITAKGQVVIYYGEEIGQHGLNNYPIQSNRNDFNWTAAETQANTEGSMLKHYQKLLEIRGTYSDVFATGTRETIAVNDTAGYDVFKRASGEDELFVALNIKSAAQNVKVTTDAVDGTIYTDLYSGKEYKVVSGSVIVSIPAAADGGTAVLVETGWEEPDEAVDFSGDLAIHVQKPNGWSKVNVYTWDINEATVSGSWPGTEMTANVDNDGWYDIKLKDIELAEGKLNMIFNNGSAQTSDTPYTIPAGTTDIWVTSVSASTVPTISNEEPTGWKVLYDVILHLDNDTKNFDEPYVYAWVNDGSSTNLAGGWPGAAMTENTANDGWVDYTLDDITYDKIGIIFSNKGANQTADQFCELEDRTTEFWLSGSEASAPLSTIAPEGWKKFASQDLILHYWNSNDWADVYAYMYADDAAVGEAWPGTELTQGSDSSWYSASIEGITTDTFKLTMNDGGAQDEANKDNDLDITLAEAENELWIKDGVVSDSDPDVNTGSPIVKGTEVTFNYANETSGKVYLQGSFNNWGGGDAYEMTDPDGDGIVSITITLEPGTYQYKFELKETGAWVADPQNDKKADDGFGGSNSVVEVIAMGLCDKNVTNVKKGTTYTLPAELDFIAEDGSKTKKAVTYELKNAEDASFVTLDGLKITPKAGISESGVELVATTSVEGTKYTATVYVYFLNEDAVDNNKITLKLHYSRPDGNYTDWNAWIWSDGLGGAAYDFVNENGEMVATVKDIPGRTTTRMGFIVRLGDWKAQEAGDQFIDLSDVVSGTVHYYVKSGVAGGTRKFDSDTITGSKIVKTAYDRTTNKVTVTLSTGIDEYDANTFVIKCTSTDSDIAITNIEKTSETEYVLTLGTDISSLEALLLSYTITYDGYTYNLMTPNVYSSDEFEAAYSYDGKDLGLTYTKEASTFKLWAPTADSVTLNIYEGGTAGTGDKVGSYEMTGGTRNEKGVWTYVLDGDWNGKYYTYTVNVANKVNEACDPYARTTGVNGKRAMILDLDSTDPDGWDADKNAVRHDGMNYTDAVIYELHVRDLTNDSSSGVDSKYQGKFMGLTQTGTTTAGGNPTALDHMVNLGITHLHLIPVYDYGSVDETKLDTPQFNWGYDPVNYNVPEGSYSTNPYDGSVRVAEMKQMIKTLHDNNINVVMDVVYNHVYDAETFSFNQVVPKYFSRTKEDGTYSSRSGCGNDTASERAMVHKYIVDSILYWHDEYHIDGFRFDLVGLIDTVTINKIVADVHAVDPDIIFYGEGWAMDDTAMTKDGYDLAKQDNSSKTPGFAYFSDTIRNGIAGSDVDGKGYIWGAAGKDALVSGLTLAKSSWTTNPSQTINYVSCHDNYTLMDKINVVSGANVTSPDYEPGEYQVALNNLAAATYMFSEGIPLIHAGEDFLRIKIDETGTVIHNSYNSPDYVNKLRWSNLDKDIYKDTTDYYKGLIEFRKNHAVLRLADAASVSANVTSAVHSTGVIVNTFKGGVNGEVSDGIVTIFNATYAPVTISEKYGITSGTEWKVCVNKEDAGTEVLETITNGSVTVPAYSVMALVKGETVDTNSIYDQNNSVTLTLDKTEIETGIGGVVAITATTSTPATLTWTSSDETVATVDELGRVTAVAEGSATITASTYHGVEATCDVTVTDEVVEASVTIDKAELSLVAGESETLVITVSPVGTEVTYGTSDETVATIDSTGKVTAIGAGTAIVTATLANGQSVSCTVTVEAAPVEETVTLNKTTLSLSAGSSETLVATVTPAGTKVTFSSKDTDVATVDANGKVTAVAEGETEIVVATAAGKTAICTVTVTKATTPAPTPTPTPTPGTGGATGGSSVGPTAGATLITPPTTTSGTTTTTPSNDTKIDVEVQTDAATEVPETVKDVTPIVDEKLQNAIAKETEQIVEDILNDELAEDVMDEETIENVKVAQKDGEGIITAVIVDKLDESKVDADVKETLAKALAENVKDKKGAETKIAQFLDLTVLLKTTSGKELGEINKLSKEMTFTIAIPEDLVKEGRAFVVLRMHEDETTVLETTMNSDGTLSFKTDRFSTYALAYIDAPAEEVTDDEGTTNVDLPDDSTTTDEEGGNYTAFIIIGLIIVIIAALFIIFLAMKRKKDE